VTTNIDGIIARIAWQEAAAVLYYVGTRTIAQIDALVPAAGWAVVAGSAGTPAAGVSDLLAIGDVAEYSGTAWKKIVTNVGGFPPDGTRAVVAWPGTATLYAPLVDGTDEGTIAEWFGASLTPSLIESEDGWTLLCEGSQTNPPTAYNENKQFSFSGTVPTGSWLQTGGPIPYGTNIQDVGLANAAGTSANLSRDDHVHKLQDVIARWTKYTVGFAALAAAALTNSVTLFNLQAAGVIHGVKIKHSTAFSGGAISAYTVAIGVAGDETRYAPDFDVFQAVSPTVYDLTGGLGGESHTAPTAILITATSVGANLNAAAAGSVDVWVLTSTAT
jgi:hypothetical protein